MAYIGKSPSVGVRDRFYYTASGGETSISGADDDGRSLVFTDGKYVDVMLNGITLVAGTDYVTSTTNTISSLDSLAASDIVEVVVYDVFSIADTVSASRGGRFQGSVAFDGGITGDGSSLTGIARNIDSLNDVTITSGANGEALIYNNGSWINDSIETVTSLGALTDVDLTGLTNGQAIVYDSDTTTWKPGAGGGGAGLQDALMLMGA